MTSFYMFGIASLILSFNRIKWIRKCPFCSVQIAQNNIWYTKHSRRQSFPAIILSFKKRMREFCNLTSKIHTCSSYFYGVTFIILAYVIMDLFKFCVIFTCKNQYMWKIVSGFREKSINFCEIVKLVTMVKM